MLAMRCIYCIKVPTAYPQGEEQSTLSCGAILWLESYTRECGFKTIDNNDFQLFWKIVVKLWSLKIATLVGIRH